MKNFYIIIVAVGVVGGGVLYYAMSGGTPTLEPVELGELDNAELIELAQPAYVFGDPDAPVTIMEFADYQCPACKRFAVMVKPQVDAEYIESGQAKLVLHDSRFRTRTHTPSWRPGLPGALVTRISTPSITTWSSTHRLTGPRWKVRPGTSRTWRNGSGWIPASSTDAWTATSTPG